MHLILAAVAALLYATGGIFMKLSMGFSQPLPTVAVYVFFLLGASMQIYITNNAHLGITYVLVLGLESLCAFLFSLLIFKESYTPLTTLGVFLVVMGTAFLRAEGG
jgi:multidrug transporter EmrE-like cation transporter